MRKIPCLPDGFSLKGAINVHETISRIQQAFNPGLVIGGVFFIRYYPRENLSRSALGVLHQMTETLGVPLLRTHIRHSNVVSDAISVRQLDVARQRPKNNAVLDYQCLVDELFERGIC